MCDWGRGADAEQLELLVCRVVLERERCEKGRSRDECGVIEHGGGNAETERARRRASSSSRLVSPFSTLTLESRFQSPNMVSYSLTRLAFAPLRVEPPQRRARVETAAASESTGRAPATPASRPPRPLARPGGTQAALGCLKEDELEARVPGSGTKTAAAAATANDGTRPQDRRRARVHSQAPHRPRPASWRAAGLLRGAAYALLLRGPRRARA